MAVRVNNAPEHDGDDGEAVGDHPGRGDEHRVAVQREGQAVDPRPDFYLFFGVVCVREREEMSARYIHVVYIKEQQVCQIPTRRCRPTGRGPPRRAPPGSGTG